MTTRWMCSLCIPGCVLQGTSDPEDPPRGCPWHHNNPDDRDRAVWREVPS